MRATWKLHLLTAFVLLFFHGVGGDWSGDYSKLSGIIIPGLASTQLRAWSILDCPYSPLDFNPLDLVWLDTTKVGLVSSLLLLLRFSISQNFLSFSLAFCEFTLQLLSAVNCWLKCMLLDPHNQTDHPDCKSRPDSGLSAITELDPGYITGTVAYISEFRLFRFATFDRFAYVKFVSCFISRRSSFFGVERMGEMVY
jgi:hypothetical protein